MDNGVILTKRKNKDLAFILRTNFYGKIDSNIPETVIKEEIVEEDDERCFAPGVSFETVEDYLKCKKEGDYEQLKDYKNRVLQLNNRETIYSVLDFLNRATKIQMLKKTPKE